MDIFSIISLMGGIALFLYGMSFMGDQLEKLSGGKLEQILEKMTDKTYKGVLLGAVVTAVIQSSSAVTVMVVGFVNSGIMQLSRAIGVIMGANIGTTVTANLAAMVANTTAKRAALAHFVFNFFGVLWVLTIFPFFLKWIEHLSVLLGIGNPVTNTEAVPMALSLFHTVFNISNVLLLIWFTKFIARVVSKLIPMRENNTDAFTLKHIKIGLLSTPDASLFQAKEEITLYAKNTSEMFHQVTECLDMPAKDFSKPFEHLVKLEDESDKIEVEIANYLTKVS